MSYEEFKNNFDEASWNLIVNYSANECSEDEKVKVEKWMDENPSLRKEVNFLILLNKSNAKVIPNSQLQKAWDELNDTIESSKKRKISSFSKAASYFIKAAAVILIMMGSYFAASQLGLFNNQTKITSHYTQKITAMGEKAIITLLDGTTVTLNAVSKLKYPSTFSNSKREIYLEGEAYFEVTHDSTKPFIVHSNNLITTVLGTKFNVKSFPSDKEINISLVEGKVNVVNQNQHGTSRVVILEPSEQLVFNKANEVSTISKFDTQKETGWKENNLVFEKEPLSKILPVLERTYGIKFELADSKLSGQKVTVNFKNDSFQTVASVLKNLTGLQYRTIKENNRIVKITFFKK